MLVMCICKFGPVCVCVAAFIVGYSAENARPIIDPASWRNLLMVPNPAEVMEADGIISQWQLFAIKEGTVALVVGRSNSHV